MTTEFQEPPITEESRREQLAHRVHAATMIGTVFAVGAIASGIALATVSPALGIGFSAVGALAGTFALWQKMRDEKRIHQTLGKAPRSR